MLYSKPLIKKFDFVRHFALTKFVQNEVLYKVHVSFCSLYDPCKELQGSCLKLTCTDNSRTLRNLRTVIKQNMYNFPRFSFDIKQKELALSVRDPEGPLYLKHISLTSLKNDRKAHFRHLDLVIP